MKASAVLNDKDVWAIAAAQSSLFFSFQLVLPNGRADEKKEEKKGIGRTSRIENGIKRFIFLWNEQWRLAQRKQSIFFFFVGGLWAHCANGSAKRRKQRRLIDWSWRMKGQRSLVEERMKWSQWMKRIDEMEFFRCPTKQAMNQAAPLRGKPTTQPIKCWPFSLGRIWWLCWRSCFCLLFSSLFHWGGRQLVFFEEKKENQQINSSFQSWIWLNEKMNWVGWLRKRKSRPCLHEWAGYGWGPSPLPRANSTSINFVDFRFISLAHSSFIEEKRRSVECDLLKKQ